MFRSVARLAVCCSLAVNPLLGEGVRYEGQGGDEVRYRIVRLAQEWEILVTGAGVDRPDQVLMLAAGRGVTGSPLVPADGGVVKHDLWLPFRAEMLLAAVRGAEGEQQLISRWEKTGWGKWEKADGTYRIVREPAQILLRVPCKLIEAKEGFSLAVWLNDLAGENGQGRVYGVLEAPDASGPGERVINASVASVRDGETMKLARKALGDFPRAKIYHGPASGEVDLLKLLGFTHQRVLSLPNEPLPEILDLLVDYDATGKSSDMVLADLPKLAEEGAAGVFVTSPQSLTTEEWRQVIEEWGGQNPRFVWAVSADKASARELLVAGFTAVEETDPDDAEESPYVFDRLVRVSGESRGLTSWRFGQSRGPVMVQADEVFFQEGEAGEGARDFYRRLLVMLDEPAMRSGDYFSLDASQANADGPDVRSFLRYDAASGQRLLVVANLSAKEWARDVGVRFSASAMRFLGWDAIAGSSRVKIAAVERLGDVGAAAEELWSTPSEMEKTGWKIRELLPGASAVYEMKQLTAAPVGS